MSARPTMHLGSGRYVAGIVLGPTAGAVVAIEKKPRKTGRYVEVENNGQEDEYEDALVIADAEVLSGDVPSMATTIAKLLASPRMKDETISYVETSTLGDSAMLVLHDRKCFASSLRVHGDVENTDAIPPTIPVRTLQSSVTLTLQSNRLYVVEGLPEGNMILRSLEHLESLPASGPRRDLALATAIAVWAANVWATRGPWASRRAPMTHDQSELAHAVREAHLQAIDRAVLAGKEDEWWEG